MSKANNLLMIFEAADVQKVKEIAKELLDKFFSEYDLPVPDVKLKNNLNPKWLARHVCFNTNRGNSNIEVQKSILDDDRTIRRVIAHELIHHWQCFKEKDDKSFNPAYHRAMRAIGKDTGHGESFEMWAKKINCYDDQTEILTYNGWKLFKDIRKREVVATLSPELNILQWQKITRKIEQDYDGKMYKIKNNAIDALVTPNHMFYVKSRRGIYKTKLISDKTILLCTIPASSGWLGLSSIDEKHIGRNVFNMSDWCAFMGIFLSEGCTYIKAPKVYRITISQKKPYNVEKILNLLKKMGFTCVVHRSNIQIENKDLALYLSQFGKCHQKFIPQDLKDLPQGYLEILKNWMMIGDGWVVAYNKGYASTSKKLIDDFQEVIIKLGYSGNISVQNNKIDTIIRGKKINSVRLLYRLGIRKGKFKSFSSSNKSYVSTDYYKGKVYCVEVPNHIIKVRRNGKEFWGHNSVMGDNYVTKKSDKEYLKSPSKEFYLVISPHDSGRFIYAYFQRPTDKTKRLLYLHKDAKVFRTNNVRFLRGRAFGTKGGWSIPSDQETQDTMKDMYSGEGIKF